MQLRSRFAVNIEIEDGEEGHGAQRFLLLLAARLLETAAKWNGDKPPTTDER